MFRVQGLYVETGRELVAEVAMYEGVPRYSLILQSMVDAKHPIGPGTPDIIAAYPEQGKDIEGATRRLGTDVVSGSSTGLGWELRGLADITTILDHLNYHGPERVIYVCVDAQGWRIMGYIFDEMIGVGIYPNPENLLGDILTEPNHLRPSPISRWLDRFLGFPDSGGTRIFWPLESATEMYETMRRIEQELA